jgi:hypothetical protein
LPLPDYSRNLQGSLDSQFDPRSDEQAARLCVFSSRMTMTGFALA